MKKLRKKSFLIEEIFKLFINYLLIPFLYSLEMDNLAIRCIEIQTRNCYGSKIVKDISYLSAFMFIFLLFLLSFLGQLNEEMYLLMLVSVLTGIPTAALTLKLEYINKAISRVDEMLNMSRV